MGQDGQCRVYGHSRVQLKVIFNVWTLISGLVVSAPLNEWSEIFVFHEPLFRMACGILSLALIPGPQWVGWCVGIGRLTLSPKTWELTNGPLPHRLSSGWLASNSVQLFGDQGEVCPSTLLAAFLWIHCGATVIKLSVKLMMWFY